MRRSWPWLGILVFVFVAAGHAQEHIPKQYRADWSHAGLVPETPRVADHLFSVVQQPGASIDEKLQSAIRQAMVSTRNGTNGQAAIVYFPPGVYRVTRPIILGPEHSNLIFQGAGSGSTVLEARFGTPYGNVFDLRGGAGDAHVSSAVPKGTNRIRIADPELFAPGDWIQYFEDSAFYQSQITRLVRFEPSPLGPVGILEDEASEDYGDVWHQVKVRKLHPVMNVGIEAMTIRRLDAGSPGEYDYGDGINWTLSYAVNCWMKGVELDKATRYHVAISGSAHIEISGSYIHDVNNNGNGGYGYGVSLGFGASDCLIENNIFRRLRHSMIVGAGANTNVFAYNYSREGRANWNGISYTDSDLNLHGRRPYANLFEQNYVQEIEADDTHDDNGPYNVFLRNKVYERAEVDLWYLPHTGFLGNDLPERAFIDDHENTSFSAEYYGKLLGGGQPYATARTLSHTESGWDSELKDAAQLHLTSYYYSERPDFLDGRYTFPSLGPRSRGGWRTTGSIPARERYNESAIKTYLPDPTGHTVVLNPGFEQGLDSWSAYGDGPVEASASDALLGARSLRIERASATGQYFGLYQQAIAVEPDTDYRLSLWVKTEGGTGLVAAAFGVWSSEAESNHHSDFGYVSGNTDWTRISGTWRSRPDERVIQVALFGDPGFTGRAYFDGLVLQEVLPRNRSFERALRYWQTYGDGTTYEAVEGGAEGVRSASVSRDAATGGFFGLVQRDIPCEPNTTYRLTLRIRTEATSGFAAAAFGNWGTPNTHQDFGYTSGHSDWVEVSSTWTSRWDESSLEIALFGSPDFSGRAFFDDLLLEEVERLPLQVSLEGPAGLGFKERGLYVAGVTAGSGSYEYEWFVQYDGLTTWEPLDGHDASQAVSMTGRGFTMRVDVLDRLTRLRASATQHVAYEDEPTDKGNLSPE